MLPTSVSGSLAGLESGTKVSPRGQKHSWVGKDGQWLASSAHSLAQAKLDDLMGIEGCDPRGPFPSPTHLQVFRRLSL